VLLAAGCLSFTRSSMGCDCHLLPLFSFVDSVWSVFVVGFTLPTPHLSGHSLGYHGDAKINVLRVTVAGPHCVPKCRKLLEDGVCLRARSHTFIPSPTLSYSFSPFTSLLFLSFPLTISTSTLTLSTLYSLRELHFTQLNSNSLNAAHSLTRSLTLTPPILFTQPTHSRIRSLNSLTGRSSL
jgi:hypothetical protein